MKGVFNRIHPYEGCVQLCLNATRRLNTSLIWLYTIKHALHTTLEHLSLGSKRISYDCQIWSGDSLAPAILKFPNNNMKGLQRRCPQGISTLILISQGSLKLASPPSSIPEPHTPPKAELPDLPPRHHLLFLLLLQKMKNCQNRRVWPHP